MTILDQVKAFVLSLDADLTDKDKANLIKEYILNIDTVTDCTKKTLLVVIKPFVIENNILNDPLFVKIINSPELYDKLMKQTNKNREKTDVIDVDMNIIEKICNLKLEQTLNFRNGIVEHNKYSLYIYLLFTSGLRCNEITNNSFTIIDDNTIKAERISKGDNTNNNNLINLLIPTKEWLHYFNILQSQIKERNIYKPSSISSGVKRMLLKIHPDLHAHSLRKLYLAYHLQVRKTGADKMPSINTKRLLNHTNEATSIFYNGVVKITGELEDIIDTTNYSKMKVIDLKNILKSKNIKYKSTMKKVALIQLINPL